MKLAAAGLVASLPFAKGDCINADIGYPFVDSFNDGMETGCVNRANITVILVHHGGLADTFWWVVEDGAYRAGADSYADVRVRTTEQFDPASMADVVFQAVSESPDGIVVSIPDSSTCDDSCEWTSAAGYGACSEPCYIGKPIEAAVAAGIEVVSINSGSNIFESRGVWHHVGQVEDVAGYGACKRLIADGATHILLPDTESAQNGGLVERTIGCKRAVSESAGVDYTISYADKSSTTATIADMKATLSNGVRMEETSQSTFDGSTVDAVLGLSRPGGEAVVKGLADGDFSFTYGGTFDFSDAIGDGLEADDITFAIDQQQWLQGYLPITYILLKVSTGNSLPKTFSNGAQNPISTGPGFITKERISVKACEASAITYCDDEADGPDFIQGSTGGRYPKGYDADCPCKTRTTKKICFIHHGGNSDSFWWVVETAAHEAALDNRIELDLRTPEFRDDDQMLVITNECINQSPAPDGLILSIPGSAFESAIQSAVAANIPVISINSGSNVFESYGAMMHVGQDEEAAGYGMASEMYKSMESKGTVPTTFGILCIDMESGTNSGIGYRCKGALDFFSSVGGEAPGHGDYTTSNFLTYTVEPGLSSIYQIGIDNSNPTAATNTLKNRLELISDTSGEFGLDVKAVIGAGAAACGAAMNLQWMGFELACFDTGSTQQAGILEGKVTFTVDQQQYLQGYLAVAYMSQYIMTGNIISSSDSISHTGPGIMASEQINFKICENLQDEGGKYVGWKMCPQKPPDQVIEEIKIEDGVTTVVFFASILGIVLAVISMIAIATSAKTKLIRASGLPFLMLTLVSMIIAMLSGVLHAENPTNDKDDVCVLRPVALVIGFMGYMVPMLVKTNALNKVLNNTKLRRIKITTGMYLRLGIPLLVIPIVILILQFATDAPTGGGEINLTGAKDEYARDEQEEKFYCWIPEDGTDYIQYIYMYMIIICFYAAYEAWQNRNVPSDFNEALTICMTIYIFIVFGFLALIMVNFSSDPTGEALGMGLMLDLAFITAWIPMFGTKIVKIATGHANDVGGLGTSATATGSYTRTNQTTTGSGDESAKEELEAALAHMKVLEDELTKAGIEVPERPF